MGKEDWYRWKRNTIKNMDAKFILKLEYPGFVLFDPYNLEYYMVENKIKTSNLMTYFIENPVVGDEIIQRGIVLPVYSILVQDYTVIVSNEKEYVNDEKELFHFKSFPLRITNNKLIVSDISALLDWDFNVFNNLPFNKSMPLQYVLQLENGDYSIDIIGFYVNEKDFGYKLKMNRTEELTCFDVAKGIDSLDFNVVKESYIDHKLKVEPFYR